MTVEKKLLAGCSGVLSGAQKGSNNLFRTSFGHYEGRPRDLGVFIEC
jgi:hypothetical protein